MLVALEAVVGVVAIVAGLAYAITQVLAVVRHLRQKELR